MKILESHLIIIKVDLLSRTRCPGGEMSALMIKASLNTVDTYLEGKLNSAEK